MNSSIIDKVMCPIIFETPAQNYSSKCLQFTANMPQIKGSHLLPFSLLFS